MSDKVPKRAAFFAAFFASLALLFFGALTAFALVGWFHRSDLPWSWKSVLSAVCALAAVTMSAFVWRRPTRTRALAGIAIMLLSLMRIGPPREWTWVSFALVAVTFVLLMPLVHAATVLHGKD